MATSSYRPIHEIAKEIRKEWTPKVNFAAVPYLEAMESLNLITDSYGADDAKYCVIYFLSNATSWRGEAARRIKAELNAMLKGKPV